MKNSDYMYLGEERMKKKVCILGCGRSSEKAPFDDDSYEIWSLNEFEPKRYDIMFELHPMSVQNEKELEFLKNCTKPVYVLEETPLVPTGIKYPLEEILKQPWAKPFFTCTFGYQIALAIYKKYEHIELWGVRLGIGSPRERTVESACVQFWTGVARGLDIKVLWTDDPIHEIPYFYGFDYFQEKVHVEDWLTRLACHIIYRLGRNYISVGGDNLSIRLKEDDE